jgi:predicted metal-dependent enzyme (double-stranded beta helix superfamily)
MSAHRRAFVQPGPTLNPAQLLAYARFVADQVRAGRYPVEYDPAQRWHQRLYRDRRVDLWLISWLPSQGTQLHDHGGSAGAFAVLSGELAEAIYQPGRPAGRRLEPGRPALTERRRGSGSGVGFGPGYVHDVRNLSRAPAASVHAYSPPLTSMGFYDLDQDGGLRTLATVPTEDPEPEWRSERSGPPAA